MGDFGYGPAQIRRGLSIYYVHKKYPDWNRRARKWRIDWSDCVFRCRCRWSVVVYSVCLILSIHLLVHFFAIWLYCLIFRSQVFQLHADAPQDFAPKSNLDFKELVLPWSKKSIYNFNYVLVAEIKKWNFCGAPVCSDNHFSTPCIVSDRLSLSVSLLPYLVG